MLTRRQVMKTLAITPMIAAPELLAQFAQAAISTVATASPSPVAEASPVAPPDPVMVRQMMTHPLPGPGKHLGAIVTVDFAPGASSPPHLHPGPVFGYVIEGTVEIGVDPLPPITYRAGDMWYEPPRHTHRTARNASMTEPARILAFLILDHGHSIAEPPAKPA